ncbi:MAG: glycosyltransferase family 4 protein [Chromatiales bacterium]|nr:glycosyltransferase family 4 protein [Chromatiales bacterium]
MAKLDQLMVEQDVLKNVHFLGYINNSAEFLSQLDLFLLSSTSEGFSISTIEAMATGLPVLVTRCGGPEEIVRPDVDGMMVTPGDPEAITEGLLVMLSNRELAQRLAEAGHAQVRTRFGVNRMLEDYIALYESCA